MYKLSDTITINNNKLTKKYIQSLTYEEREDLIEPIFTFFKKLGFPQPNDTDKLDKEYNRLLNKEFDFSNKELFNNSSVATYICHYFCWDLFYSSKEVNKKSVIDVFNDDNLLKKVIANRLGMDWLKNYNKTGVGLNEAFNFTIKQIITGARSSRKAPAISLFKPDIAKYLCQFFSNENDVVLDYSAGFGGRLLGAAACNRKYIGIDPLTTDCLNNMVNYFNFKNITLINSGSENVNLSENIADFCYSSPPYYNQEFYSDSKNQAYNNGESYFYEIYWKNTLKNMKNALKPEKYFGLNILHKYEKMINMAKEEFGDPVDLIKLRTVRSHLTKNKKTTGVEKYEPIYIFNNIK